MDGLCSTDIKTQNMEKWIWSDTTISSPKQKDHELCKVIEQKSLRDFKSCIFPFSIIVDGIKETFDSCTNVLDLEGKYWCSTKVRFLPSFSFFEIIFSMK